VAADEIFVLLLVVVCVGTVVTLSFRSRRQARALAAANPESTGVPETPELAADTPEPEVRQRRRKRR